MKYYHVNCQYLKQLPLLLTIYEYVRYVEFQKTTGQRVITIYFFSKKPQALRKCIMTRVDD